MEIKEIEASYVDKRSFKVRVIKEENEFLTLMNKHFKYLEVDKEFVKAIKSFRLGIMHNNIDFLSNKFLGVYPFKITPDDWDVFFLDICRVDRVVLQKELYGVKDIFKERLVTSNVINLTISYLLHRVAISDLSEVVKEECIHELGLILGYRFMSSSITERFQRPLSLTLAKGAVDLLSYKFIIKRLNNWQEYFDYRADDLKLDGLHKDRMKKIDAFEAGRIAIYVNTAYRSTFNRYYNVIKMVIANNSGVNSTSITGLDPDGEEVIKVVTDRPDGYVQYIMSIVSDSSSFIKHDLVSIVLSMMDSVSEKNLLAALTHLSDSSIHEKKVGKYIEVILEVNIEYLNTKGSGIANEGLASIMGMIRGLWMVSSVKDKRIRKLKEDFIEELGHGIGVKKRRTLASLTIAVVLYILLRSIIRK